MSLVLTCGVFDILHRGHVELLRQARALGSRLVVGINSDASAWGLAKGPGRPINRHDDRAAVLMALRFVDDVWIFNEPTPAQLVQRMQPGIYVKGGDYTVTQLPETRGFGGMVVILPRIAGYSTTGMLERARW